MLKREGFKIRIGSWLFHIKLKRHGNATGLEIYLGRLSESYRKNLNAINKRRQS